jgi:hypothetical protein
MQKGNSIVEVVVGATILSVVALAFLGAMAALSRFHERDMYAIKGSLLTEEGIEALRYIKDTGWANISSVPVNQTRYLLVSPNAWAITTNPEIIDGVFYRSFKISQVQRNSTDDIVSSGGVVDLNTLLLDVSVSWQQRGSTTTSEYKTYITNI